jgi:hypothetical protein
MNSELRRSFIIGFLTLLVFIGTSTYVNFKLAVPPLALSPMAVRPVYFMFLPSPLKTPLAGGVAGDWVCPPHRINARPRYHRPPGAAYAASAERACRDGYDRRFIEVLWPAPPLSADRAAAKIVTTAPDSGNREHHARIWQVRRRPCFRPLRPLSPWPPAGGRRAPRRCPGHDRARR